MSKLKIGKSIKIPLIILFLVGSIFCGIELYLREQVWKRNFEDVALWRTLFYSGELSREPFKSFSFRMYGKGGLLEMAADIRLNNMGYFSRKNYQYEKEKNEYRILVLGGEQAASSVANASWPDFLEDELNKRYPKKKIKVINLAWPDAGPEHYIDYWKNEGCKFKPDLVVINYVETDFYRTIDGAGAKYKGHPIINWPSIKYKLGDGYASTRLCSISKKPAESFAFTEGIPARPYGFFASASLFKNGEDVCKMQKKIVNDMIEGLLDDLWFGQVTFESLKRKREYIPSVAEIRNFDSFPSTIVDQDRLIRFGVEKFGWLSRNIGSVIIVHNFHYGELKAKWELTEKMQNKDPLINVVDMRQYVPRNTSEEEVKSWYQIPHMGEKWSDKGHAAYGKMMADMLSLKAEFCP